MSEIQDHPQTQNEEFELLLNELENVTHVENS